MSFSRAQMIEAFESGQEFHIDVTQREWKQQIIRAAERYVDSLQDAPSGARDAAPIDYRSGIDPEVIAAIEGLDTTIREHILKSQERELVLAKVLGSLIAKAPMYFEQSLSQSERFLDYEIEIIGQLNRVFPELTPEE